MRVDRNQFINFHDFHISFSKDDQLKIVLENDPDSGFIHSFGLTVIKSQGQSKIK